jgi:hypothetical protein
VNREVTIKTPAGVAAILALLIAVGGGFAVGYPTTVRAQESMKDAVETFAIDLHHGMQRGNLTPQQKEQILNDLQTLRTAQQTGDRRSALRAMMSFRRVVNSGAFQPEDAERIKQDMKNIRAAKKAGGGGMGMGGGMGGGGMGGGMP